MQLSSRILTALAVLILAVAVVGVRSASTGTVEAATGTIDVVNVGTCYTTNDDAFTVADCDDGDGNAAGGTTEGYNVAGRDAITEVGTGASVYATYAIDPKTSGDAPRAILTNSDLIKISIEDKKRDKRSGILYGVGSTTDPAISVTTDTDDEEEDVIERVLGETLSKELQNATGRLQLTSTIEGATNTTNFTVEPATISSSGIYRLNMTGLGNTLHPMAPRNDGKIFWFGCLLTSGDTCDADPGDTNDTDTLEDFKDLKNYISLDEDLSSGTRGSLAPWMRITASVPTGRNVVIKFIYYQTSKPEVLIGGCQSGDYDKDDATDDNCVAEAAGEDSPVFVDDEVPSTTNTKPDALVLRASADGDAPNQNLWLKETGDFTGVYEGYVRLTDADGHGDSDDKTPGNQQDNWGRDVKSATGSNDAGAAVIGVESGPVSITYKNSNGDTRTAKILIDKDPPAIQIDSPLHNASSKDDSPDLLGSFSDGGGAGLRDDSFKIYADNTDDTNDESPIWDFRVDDSTKTGSPGYVCVDADDDDAGDCETGNPIAALRGHYAGYGPGSDTFGIIKSEDVYLSDADGGDTDEAKDYKIADAEDYEDGDTSGLFDSVVRIDFPPPDETDNRYNNTIDIQAVVLDIAGNYGFSDSQASDPTFIHDYGTVKKDRDKSLVHNVLGWYSRHQYRLDDVDPFYKSKESATGFYTDEDGDETVMNSGVKVVFDGDIDASSVGTSTFIVKLDNGETATVADVDVDGRNVYLKLEEEMAPDETPSVDLASGSSILDLAGNESTERRLDGIEVNDGILPTFTITLSGGSGLNEDIDGEGASELTKNQMTISIESNEDIQGAPKFTVVCEKLTWGTKDKPDAKNNVAKFASNRSGALSDVTTAEPTQGDHGVKGALQTTCDGTALFSVAETSALARPGNRWEYLWSDLDGDQSLADGKLSVIVWGRDRSSYEKIVDGATKKQYNYSSSTGSFSLDRDLKAAWEAHDGAELVPDDGDNVFEPRPFVLLDFGKDGAGEKTTVDVTKFTIDKVDHFADLQRLDDNEFVWWPQPLAYGTYTVYVEANDAANNQEEHTYKFTVKERAPFVLSLLAGWNSVSLPANPVDRALHAVFTNEAVDQVVGWNVTEPVSPWRMASRVDGVWTTNDDYATLNDIEARYGYWVHSTGFITQAVHLAGQLDRGMDGQPAPADIPTDEGWNFVGVVDVDGDQTQDDAGETLRNSNNDPITAAEYLGNYTRAYTWDHVNNTWDVVKMDEGITIGTGVWVYYTKDHDIAP